MERSHGKTDEETSITPEDTNETAFNLLRPFVGAKKFPLWGEHVGNRTNTACRGHGSSSLVNDVVSVGASKSRDRLSMVGWRESVSLW